MSSIFNTVAVIWRAGAGNVPVAGPKSLFKRVQFLCEAYVDLLPIHQWINTDISDAVRTELRCSPVLVKALTHPYVHRLWDFNERSCKITSHYRLLTELNLPFLNFSENYYWTCAEFDMGERNFRIVIDRPRWMRSEGEMTISLFMGVDRLYSIAFLIGGARNAPLLLVGAIQGMPKSTSETLYSELTKIFHGARPRDLMVQVLKMVAKNIGCNEVLAISDDFHQSVGRGNETVKASKYDTIWLEHGGVKGDSGFFVLPSTSSRRADEDIPARKRALYRRRYAFLDMLQAHIQYEFSREDRSIQRHTIAYSDF